MNEGRGREKETDVVMAANTADVVAVLLFIYGCEE